MSKIDENWLSLSKGIEIPSIGLSIPWLANVDDLFHIVPQKQFSFSAVGGWPILRFKFLGFSALWGFNFVSDSSERFTELQFLNKSPHSPRRTYRRSRAALHKALGTPNLVNYGLLGQQTWRRDGVCIINYVLSGNDISPGNTITVPSHFLSIRHDNGA